MRFSLQDLSRDLRYYIPLRNRNNRARAIHTSEMSLYVTDTLFKGVTMSLFECYTGVNGMVCHIVVKVPYLNVP